MTRLQIRRGTSAQWASTNPILAAGEPGLDTTTGIMKVGDGVTYWNALLSEWAPTSMVANAPRGVVAAAIGTAGDGLTIATNLVLAGPLTFTFEAARKYRIWYTIRALTAGGVRMIVTNNGVAFNTDQYFSSDRSYDGATVNWFCSGISGAYILRVVCASGSNGALIYGKDFYVEDIGGG
jgi:hypothetical protein